jgi:hypothetical protein
MDTDTDILKTLQSIERLLKSSSSTAGAGRLSALTSAERSKKPSARQEDREQIQIFRATTKSLKDMNDTVVGLDTSLLGLDSEVQKASSHFVSLSSSMSKFMASLTPINIPPDTGPVNPPDNQNKQSSILSSLQNFLSKTYQASQSALERALNGFRDLRSSENQPIPLPATAGGATDIAPVKDLVRASSDATISIENFSGGIFKTGRGFAALQSGVERLAKITAHLADDFFSLSHVGLGSYNNLYNLSIAAFKSGMSLKEYASVVQENITAVSRAGSLDNFNKLISAADGQLAEMGVFGKDARELQGALAQSSTLLGVSQDKLSGAISEQISLFDKLHKSTNMSSREFTELVRSVADNEQVQNELVGLNGQDRDTRRQGMLQLQSFGQTIGMTADASRKLGEAMIAARGETVKNRITESGRIRQLAQFLNMGSAGERAAQLSLKGRARTSAEDLEFRQIAQDLERASQAAYENSGIGGQGVLDQMLENISGTGFGRNMKESKQVALAEDSGTVKNRDFGQHVDKFGQFVGELLKYVHGFNESIGPAVLSAATAGAAFIFRGPLLNTLSAGLSKIPGLSSLGNMLSGGTGAAGGIGGISEILSTNIFAPIKNFIPTLSEMGSALSSIGVSIMGAGKWILQIPTFIRQSLNALTLSNAIVGPLGTLKNMGSMFSEGVMGGIFSIGSAIKNSSAAFITSAKGFAGSFAITTGIFNAAIEMFTGNISDALNPEGGFFNRLGGIATAFFSGIPDAIIDIVSFVFSEDISKTMRSGFDMFVAATNAAVRTAFASIIDGWSNILSSILPSDSKLLKNLKQWSGNIQDSADENFKAFDMLWNKDTDSLKDMNAKYQKTAEDRTKKAEAATVAVVAAQNKFNNVQYGTDLTRTGVINDARAVIGEPQVQAPPTVKTEPVNNTNNESDTPSISKKVSTGNSDLTGTSDILAALNTLVSLMRESLVNEERQVQLTEQMLKTNRPAATFTSAEVYADRLLKQGYV